MSESDATLPTNEASRIASLDVLRGFALLGILLMNIQSFSMIEAAYLNPRVLGPVQGVEGAIWFTTHLFADSKFISMFSMLFGAGIVLMAERRVAAGKGAALLHYRRLLGLLVIGLIHSYLFWPGDILVPYAVCGAIVFLAWRLSPKWQFIIAALLMLLGAGLIWFFGWSIPYWGEEAITEIREGEWHPSRERIEEELAVYRGSWLGLLMHRIPVTLAMQFLILPTMLFWHISGLMLIGMGLYKTGILSGQRDPQTYRRMFIIGLGIGLPLIAIGAMWNFQADWQFEYSMFQGTLPNYFGSLAVAIGYVSGLLLLLRTSLAQTLTRSLAPVGRLALTNYLAQTVICTTLFYGYGVGWYGQVSRVQQLLVVVIIWCIQIAASAWWIKRYRFGPVEYVWRTLSYGSAPALRRRAG